MMTVFTLCLPQGVFTVNGLQMGCRGRAIFPPGSFEPREGDVNMTKTGKQLVAYCLPLVESVVDVRQMLKFYRGRAAWTKIAVTLLDT